MSSTVIKSLAEMVAAQQQQQEDQARKDLELIANSELRDQLAKELLLDRVLAPADRASVKIQNAAKFLNHLAEMIVVYHRDHGIDDYFEAESIARELRCLAILLAHADSLRDVKAAYAVSVLYLDKVAHHRHRILKYSIEQSFRECVLNPLNDCIANLANFERRSNLYG